ncbi:hypothetical protein F4774DRAFT_398384 [Daldinia eschscholtzii]|nr:hypothetical protein F4774DRAFT_398384 [Daldinia eschscholtzii]
MAPTLLDLIGQYPILTTIASYVSTLDLYSLGLSCRKFHAYILSSPEVFDVLRRDCLCDGRGLLQRQNWDYNAAKHKWSRISRSLWGDEEIEVKLFAVKCDEANALPCLKCGINICEECRAYPRTPPANETRRPHFNRTHTADNIMCLCDACDDKLEEQLKGKFLNELCDCDRYRRWICFKCEKQEYKEAREYRKKHTVLETDDYPRYVQDCDSTKCMVDHQFDVLFYCICGAFVPEEARPRCTWCKRKHRPEEEWGDEWREMEKIPFDEEGCYPIFDPYATSYVTLAYNGPIYQVPPGSNKA